MKPIPSRPSRLAACLLGLCLPVAGVGGAWAAEALPRAPEPFAGKIAPAREQSVPAWPRQAQAPAGAPNVVVILLDDVGFSAPSTFGGVAQTPTLQALADQGLSYNQFHVTSLCSPTRAEILTGRNHHQAGFGTVANSSSGFPGYNSVWQKVTVSVAEVLRQNGYGTAAFGKWHNTPSREITPAGPYDHWPTSLGFEVFYGFHGGAENQYEPRIWRNTTPVEPARTPEQGYHLIADLAEQAQHWLRAQDAVFPNKPFFVWFAPGGTHWPQHVPADWIARYQGRFDQGWDRLREENFARQKKLGVIPASAELTPRPPELPAWDSLTPDEKTLLAREAEVSAAYLAYTDAQVGRVLDEIRAQVRSVFSHVTDIAPTIYELTGVALPDSYEGIRQVPLEGQSLAATFDPPRGSTAHTRQYFEIGGTRGIYQDGWWAGTRNARNQPGSVWNSEPTGYRPWELYHLDEDYSQAHELAARTASRPISWCPSAAATA